MQELLNNFCIFEKVMKINSDTNIHRVKKDHCVYHKYMYVYIILIICILS